jgi:HlyD family secretion protein
VYVENKDGALYPGMTANTSIRVAAATNAIVVPLAALQWAPPRAPRANLTTGTAPGSPWGLTDATVSRTVVAGRNGRVYVLRDGQLVRIAVRVTLISDTQAAVKPIGAALDPGDTVVTSDSQSQVASQQSKVASSLTRSLATTLGRPAGSQH